MPTFVYQFEKSAIGHYEYHYIRNNSARISFFYGPSGFHYPLPWKHQTTFRGIYFIPRARSAHAKEADGLKSTIDGPWTDF